MTQQTTRFIQTYNDSMHWFEYLDQISYHQQLVREQIEQEYTLQEYWIENNTNIEQENVCEIISPAIQDKLSTFSYYLIDQCGENYHGTQWKQIQKHYFKRLKLEYNNFLRYLLFTLPLFRSNKVNQTHNDYNKMILDFLKNVKQLVTPLPKQKRTLNSTKNLFFNVKNKIQSILNQLAKFNQQKYQIIGYYFTTKYINKILILISKNHQQFQFYLSFTQLMSNNKQLSDQEKNKKANLFILQQSKKCLSILIDNQITIQKQKKQTCLNCENKIQSCKISLYSYYQQIQQIEVEIQVKVQDLNALSVSIKQIRQEKTKQLQFTKKPKSIYKFNNKFSKSLYDPRNTSQLILKLNKKISQQSDQQESFFQESQNFCLKDLSIQQLNKCTQTIDEVKRFVLQTKNCKKQKPNTNINIQIKQLKRQIKQNEKMMQTQDIIQCVNLIIKKLKIVQKIRQIQNKMNKGSKSHKNSYFQSEYQQLNSNNSFYKLIKRGPEIQPYSDDESVSASVCHEVNQICFKDFKLIRLLAQGKYGQVFLVKKIKTGIKYAMKRIKIKYLDHKGERQKLRNQKNAFSIANNQFLVKAIFSFTQGKYHYFIMQYAPNGDFADKLMQEQRLFQYQAKPLLAEIAVAINSLHQHGIIHRDIKPQNIVIDQEGHLKLTDYGLSETNYLQKNLFQKREKAYSKFIKQQMIKKSFTQPQRRIQDKIVGSPYYMAPQVLSFQPLTKMSDWWSFGILIYQTLVGEPPFLGKNLQEISSKILQGNIWWTNEISFGDSDNMISYQAKDLIQLLLTHNPEKRLGQKFQQIKTHSFFQGIQWQNLRQTPSPIQVYQQQQQYEQQSTFSEQTFHSYGSTSPDLKLIRRDILLKDTKTNYYKHIARLARLRKTSQCLRSSISTSTLSCKS